jgi:tetratricopeptide (TPR) repeat protein
MTSNIIYVAFGGPGEKLEGGAGASSGDDVKQPAPEKRPAATAGSGSGFYLQGEHRSLVDLYTRRQVSVLVGVPEGKLKWWEKCGLIRPSRKYGREKFYTFENLIAVRAAKELTDKGCRAAKIKNAIRKLCEQLPSADRPLTKMKVCGNGRRLVIEREGQDVEIDSGQILIDFSVSSVVKCIQDRAAADAARKKALDGRSAYEWFLDGVRLEDEGGSDKIIEAENAYRKALEIEPDMAPAMTNLGNLKFRRDELKEAEHCYREAIRYDPYLPQPYYNLGCLKLNAGRSDLALIFLKKAHELDPDFADVCFHLALALEQEGRKEEALAHFRKFLEMEEDSSWSEIAREKLEELK